MSITVQFASYEEMVAFAKKLVGEQVSPKEGKAKTAPVKEEVIKEVESTVDEEEQTLVQEEAKSFTLEEVRAALSKLTRAGKQKEVKALLASFNASNLSGVDPKDYAELMEKAGEQ